MAHIQRTNFRGDPNIGFYGLANDDFCIVGNNVTKNDIKKIKKILKVDVVKASVADSEFLGLFSASNKNGIVLPRISTKDEIKVFEELGLNVCVPKIRQTALGNLILVNSEGCLVSKDLKGVKEKIEKCFKVPVRVGSIAGLAVVGSSGVVTNKGLLVHRDCKEEEFKVLEKVLKKEAGIGTVSFGSPFVGASVLANTNGFLASEQTTGPELQRIDEALGFI